MTDLKLATPQAMSIYQLLCENGALTAAEIGGQLHIMPNAVYRCCKQLKELGVLNEQQGFPVKFCAVQPNKALAWFLVEARRSF